MIDLDAPVTEVLSLRFLLENALKNTKNKHSRSFIKKALQEDTDNIKEIDRLLENAIASSQSEAGKSLLNTTRDVLKRTIKKAVVPEKKKVVPKKAITPKKKDGFVPNAFWAEVNKLKKGGLSESQAKKKAEETMKGQDNIISLDSLLLKNQPIAKEGILSYNDGMKLKRWEDLRRNIGRVVPILDEHPSTSNGKKGLATAADKKFGKAKIKQCGTKKRLCADLDLDDDAPVKKGFSIGYPFEQLDEPGVHDGNRYDSIQANLVIDHLALTNHPRDIEELLISGDAKYYFVGDSRDEITQDNSLNNTIININQIGYDSIEFTGVEKQREIRDLARKLKRENPETTASDEMLLERARVMLENEQELNKQDVNKMIQGADINQEAVKEEEKEEAKEKTSGDGLLDLVKENEQLKAKLAAHDATDSISHELKTAQDALAAKNKIIEEYHQKELKVDIDSLVKQGFKSEEFNGKTPEFVAGVLYGMEHVSKGPNNGKKITEVDSVEDLRYGRDTGYDPGRWSHKLGKYVPHAEWTGE